MKIPKNIFGFTFAELLVTCGVASITALLVVQFGWTATRLVARNFTANHSHDDVRGAAERVTYELRNSGSYFGLINFDGTTFTDVNSAGSGANQLVNTGVQDKYSQKYISTSANGCRFRKVYGPYVTTVAPTSGSSTLTADFSPASTTGIDPITPLAGDIVYVPLVRKDFSVSSVSGSVLTLSSGFGYNIKVGSTIYILRKVAFAVSNSQLRYYPDYPATTNSSFIRLNITSDKPFSLLYPTSTSTQEDTFAVRLSFEAYEAKYSNRQFAAGSSTLLTIVPVRAALIMNAK